jgi:hypothetical protein
MALLFLIGTGGSIIHAQSEYHVVTGIHRKISVKRAKNTNFVSAYTGMWVGNSDKFRLDSPDSVMTVTCSDGKQQIIRTGHLGLQCLSVPQGSKPVVGVYKKRRITRPRGGVEGDMIPVVISPRMTRLLDRYPLIRWQPTRGGSDYKVKVLEGPNEIWSADVKNGSSVKYPENPATALVPGNTYRVVISTETHSSLEDKTANLGFSIVPAAEARAIKSAATRIRNLRLSDIATRLLLAQLYAGSTDRTSGKALYAEAIELLEAVADKREPAVLRLLGDLYLDIELSGRAEGFYAHASTLSQESGDVEGQSLAEHALGMIFAQTKLNRDEAIKHLQNAKALYEQMGDAAAIAEIDKEIQSLKK